MATDPAADPTTADPTTAVPTADPTAADPTAADPTAADPATVPIVSIEGFKYLVVRTGYTARLVRRVDEMKEEFRNLYCECEGADENCKACRDTILYINDNVWGIGMYPITSSQEEIDYVRTALGKAYGNGIIVLRCDSLGRAFEMVEILMQMGYCACFRMSSLYGIKQIDEKILRFEFDCESG